MYSSFSGTISEIFIVPKKKKKKNALRWIGGQLWSLDQNFLYFEYVVYIGLYPAKFDINQTFYNEFNFLKVTTIFQLKFIPEIFFFKWLFRVSLMQFQLHNFNRKKNRLLQNLPSSMQLFDFLWRLSRTLLDQSGLLWALERSRTLKIEPGIKKKRKIFLLIISLQGILEMCFQI